MNPLSDTKESELVAMAKVGNHDAFEELYSRYSAQIYCTLRRMTNNRETAEDLLQEAAIKAFRKINRFDERSSFCTWFFRIAVNTALSHTRTEGEKIWSERIDIDQILYRLSDHGSEAKKIEQEIDAPKLEIVISRLPKNERIVFIACDFHHWNPSEVAERLVKDESTVKRLLAHARLTIRKALSQ